MDKKTVLRQLSEVANALDTAAFTKEADVLTHVMKRVAQMGTYDDVLPDGSDVNDPFEQPSDSGAKGFLAQNGIMVNRELPKEALDAIAQIVQQVS